MPLYEYRCSKCDKVFEKLQKFSDAPLTVHEDCGGTVERLISTSGLHFKGSGFYITDYAKSGSAPKNASSGDSAKGGKSDSKPGDSKSSDSKSSESKSESKASESKSSETKTESKPASTSKND